MLVEEKIYLQKSCDAFFLIECIAAFDGSEGNRIQRFKNLLLTQSRNQFMTFLPQGPLGCGFMK